LKKGDIIGQYSILRHDELHFFATAISNVRILTLSRSFLINDENSHKIQHLEQAISFGTDLIKEDGVAIQDYRFHPYNKLKMANYINSNKYKLKEKQK